MSILQQIVISLSWENGIVFSGILVVVALRLSLYDLWSVPLSLKCLFCNRAGDGDSKRVPLSDI